MGGLLRVVYVLPTIYTYQFPGRWQGPGADYVYIQSIQTSPPVIGGVLRVGVTQLPYKIYLESINWLAIHGVLMVSYIVTTQYIRSVSHRTRLNPIRHAHARGCYEKTDFLPLQNLMGTKQGTGPV